MNILGENLSQNSLNRGKQRKKYRKKDSKFIEKIGKL